MSKPHVAVVGAGIAGLRCAAVLLERGVRVTILEARDRIGGRICQSDALGYPADLGPQWIHTSGENPLLTLATETGTPVHSWNGKTNIYDSDGTLVEAARADRFSDLVWETVDEALKYSEERGDEISADESLYDFFSRKAGELFPASEEDRRLLLNMSQMWGAYIGHPVDRQSLRFAWMEHCCVGDEVIVTSTYAAILAKIAELPLSRAEVQLNERVVSIEAAEDARPAGRAVVLRTADGETQSFDEVVLTTPLGWLKRNKAAFSPALPARLSQAIDGVSVGNLEKVFISFPEAFWLGGDDEEDTFPGYTNFLAPHHASETNPARWPQEAYNLAAFAAPHRHATLLFYLYGDCAHALVSLAASAPSPAGVAAQSPLWPFFAPYVALLPHYEPSAAACAPSAILATAWLRDPLAGHGSYVNFQVGAADAAGDVASMREGMGVQRKVWLAGEHTSPFEECGTATGAYLAGEGVGRRILGLAGLA
ncbi:MAG: hypothetical protein M1832_006309 [Thelocarpon impressellum]|nr:MAG: hypothetical protein M1832_006309 [Thelocarpon impressellum]